MNMDEVRKMLLAKRNKPILSEQGALSTGSTLLNLACNDHPYAGLLKGRYYLCVGDSSAGKAQPLNAMVLTPSGWVRMGDVEIGDQIIDPDGGRSRITGIFPQGNVPVFRVTLSDGTSTRCTAEHLWIVRNGNDKARGTERIKTTEDLHRSLASRKEWEKWYIPICKAVDFESESTKLPIHPYVLGALLGNGHIGKNTIRFSGTDSQTIDQITVRLPFGITFRHRKLGDYELCVKRGSINPLIRQFKSLGLSGCLAHQKFIPETYLVSNIEYRRWLLRGLLDTDGTVGKNGALSFGSSSLKLVNGVADIVRSLGGVVSITSKIPHYFYKGKRRSGRRAYCVSIRAEDKAKFITLERKKKRIIPDSGHVGHYIKSIDLEGEGKCQCISTNSRRSLYVTDDYLVTHNTWTAMTTFAEATINQNFKDYRLIYDDVEGGALMDISRYFGKKAAERLESPAVRDGNPANSETIEDFYYNIYNVLKKGQPCFYVLDSENALRSKASRAKFIEQKTAHEKGNKEVGSYGDGKAKYHSENLREVVDMVRKTNSILMILSQSRDNVSGFGFEKKIRSGGRALTFYATTEIWMSPGEKIKRSVRGEMRTLGVECLAHAKKNRVTGKIGKDRSVVIPIYYSYGIDDTGSCVDFVIENGLWKKAKDKLYDCPELKFAGSRQDIVLHVEDRGLENKLRAVVAKLWADIEAECEIDRKPRYQ